MAKTLSRAMLSALNFFEWNLNPIEGIECLLSRPRTNTIYALRKLGYITHDKDGIIIPSEAGLAAFEKRVAINKAKAKKAIFDTDIEDERKEMRDIESMLEYVENTFPVVRKQLLKHIPNADPSITISRMQKSPRSESMYFDISIHWSHLKKSTMQFIDGRIRASWHPNRLPDNCIVHIGCWVGINQSFIERALQQQELSASERDNTIKDDDVWMTYTKEKGWQKEGGQDGKD